MQIVQLIQPKRLAMIFVRFNKRANASVEEMAEDYLRSIQKMMTSRYIYGVNVPEMRSHQVSTVGHQIIIAVRIFNASNQPNKQLEQSFCANSSKKRVGNS